MYKGEIFTMGLVKHWSKLPLKVDATSLDGWKGLNSSLV